MQKRYRNWNMSALAILAAAAVPIVRAQSTRTWTGGTAADNLWTDIANWDTAVPVSGDTAQFLDAGNGNTNISLGGAAQPINTILFSGTSTSYTLGALGLGDAFNFDSLGAINVNSTVQVAQTINADINANGSMIVTNNGTGGLTLGGNVVINNGGTMLVTSSTVNSTTTLNGNITEAGGAGSMAYVINGGSSTTSTNLIINGANTYTGTTALSVSTGTGGSVQIASNSAFGIGKVLTFQNGTNASQIQQITSLTGPRTLANAFDMNGGLTFIGSNTFTFTGPLNITQSAIGNTNPTVNNLITAGPVTFGSSSSPSTITLGNPIANGGDGTGKTADINAGANGAVIVLNDVIQDPSGTGHGSVGYGGVVGGVVQINSQNTYSGSTFLNGNTTIQFHQDYNAGDTAGPFGTSTIVPNNSNNNFLEPLGGNRTLANPISLSTGFTVVNATGDTSGLTFTGPIAMSSNGRTIADNFAAGAVLILGSAALPSTFTLSPNTSVQTLQFTGPGALVINDTIQNFGTVQTNINFNDTGATTVNGAFNSTGTVAFAGTGGVFTLNTAMAPATLSVAGTSVTIKFNAPVITTTLTVSGGGDQTTFNGTVTATSLTISGTTNNVTTFNAPIAGSGSVTSSAGGLINFNVPNTYSGGTLLSGGSTIIPINFSTTLSGTSIVSGPFGSGAITFNNSANQHLRPIGNQTLANPLTLSTGFAMENVAGDNSSLTFTGPITLQAIGRTITNGFSIANGTNGGALILGSSPNSNFLTLPTGANQSVGFVALDGPIVINDIIRDGGVTGSITINPNNNNIQNVTLSGANTYSGSTTIGGQTNGAGTILLGVSSVTSGTNIVSGPFGMGTVIMNQSATTPGALPPILTPIGANRTVANAITLNSGFFAQNSTNIGAFNLSLTGPITLGTTGRVITNNMIAGTTLTLGAAASPSTITIGSTLQFQSQVAGSSTIVNDLVQDGTSAAGGILVTSGLTQLTNASNTYSAGSTVNGGVLSISADGNLGALSGIVSVGAGTLLATGSFTTARGFSLTDASSSTLDSTAGNTLSLTGPMTDVGTVNKGTNLGTVQLAQPTGYTATGNVNVLGGTLSVGSAAGATGPLSVPGTLTVADTAKVALLPSTTGVGTNSGVVHSINNLNLNNTGILDLGNTAVSVSAATPIATIRQYLTTGYSNGNWNGTSGGGITSTWAANDATHRTAVGYAAQPDGTTLVAATLYGDTTLKGSVGLSDYNTLAANFNKPGVWAQGDFDYDGTVTLADYNKLATNFNKSAQPGGGVAAAGAGAAAKAASVTLTGSASPAASVLPDGVVDPGAGNVVLEANPSTGQLYLVGHDSNINSYEVDSAAGKLTFVSQKNHGGYNTLTAQSGSTGLPGSALGENEDIWATISSAAGTFVAEAYPAGSNPAFDTFGPGLQVFDLNVSGLSAWTAGTPISDLTFKYGNGTGNTLTPAVIPIGVPEPTCLALAGIAAGGLLSRRRRRIMGR